MTSVVTFPDGTAVPALGQGTWRMGESRAAREGEIAALRLGLDLGLTLIDTAEMYGDGAAETLVGEAVRGRRDEAFIVSKVYPHNASRAGTAAACERSLKRLGTDRIDLYLLHWRGAVPLAETVQAFESLRRAGKIVRWGVSNLDLDDMRELHGVPGGQGVAANQVLYNLSRRGVEFDLLPWIKRSGVAAMAYSPVEQARLLEDARLAGFARRHGMTAAQAALAWLLAQDGVIVIPKTSSLERVRENALSRDVRLSPAQLAELDSLFPPPREATPLDML